MSVSNEKTDMSFEAAMERLQVIVRMLEAGDAPLDESLGIFEEGIGLVKMCNEKLENAEQRIIRLTKQPDGSMADVPFSPAGADGAKN